MDATIGSNSYLDDNDNYALIAARRAIADDAMRRGHIPVRVIKLSHRQIEKLNPADRAAYMRSKNSRGAK